MEQTVIYIDDKQKYDASVATRGFTNENVKNRVYINTMGADLLTKYLISEGIKTEENNCLHSIRKIIQEFDVADIILNNIRIDVRVVFDEKVIFVPKKHYEYNLTPDIYVAMKIDEDFSNVKILGFFKPYLINKNNENSEYYFIEPEKLSASENLIEYIKSYEGNTEETPDENTLEKASELIVSMTDDDISENDKKFLIENLTKSSELREKFIEFENFEHLSYKVISDNSIEKYPIINEQASTTNFQEFENDEFENLNTEEPDIIDINNINNTEDLLEDINNDSDLISLDENLDDNLVENPIPEIIEDSETINIDNIEELTNEESEGLDIEDLTSLENIEPELITIDEEPKDTISLDDIKVTEDITHIDEDVYSTPISLDDIDNINNSGEIISIESDKNSEDTFSKNLLENLAEENMNNIEIEGTDYNAINNSAPDNLLSQIDDEISPKQNEIEYLPNNEDIEYDNPQENTIENSGINDEQEIAEEIDISYNEPSEDNYDENKSDNTDLTEEIPEEDSDKLNVLYTENEDVERVEDIEEPQETDFKPASNSNTLKIAIASVVLISLLATGITFNILRQKDNKTADIEPIPNSTINTNNNNDELTENILETNAPENVSPKQVSTQKKQTVLKNTSGLKKQSSIAFMSVSKVVWDVPDNLSYSSNVRNYLRTVGKSIKTSLSADLLLADEYAYNNYMKLQISYSSSGILENTKIVQTSGSTQVDNIVLQTVKETLNAINPPSEDMKGKKSSLYLIIYF